MVGDNNQINNEDTSSEIRKPILSFKRTNEAAVRNIKILAATNGDSGSATAEQNGSPLNYGSEFRDTSYLIKLFYHHEDKINIINIIQQGSHYHLYPIEQETRKCDLDAMIIRGNQKLFH